MQVDLNDQRLQNIVNEKNNTLSQVNSQYNSMINNSDKFYQEQKDLAKNYEQTQKQLQQQNTDFAIQKIEQQKDKAEKEYTREQKGAYADYQKASNDYGVNAEQLASSGLTNSGVSETSRVSMYNQYQSRYASARQTYNDAVLNYDNSIKEAQLQNNSALAEISYNALKEQLELGLQGFQYKNTLLQQQIQTQQSIEEQYQNRWNTMLNQINVEREFAQKLKEFEENTRRANAQLDLQRQQLELSRQQFNWQKSQSSSSGGGYGLNDLISLTEGGGTSAGEQYGYFSNGYQPKGINGYGKVQSTGSDIYVINSKTGKGKSQNIWKTPDGTKWYWNGNTRTYEKLGKGKNTITI